MCSHVYFIRMHSACGLAIRVKFNFGWPAIIIVPYSRLCRRVLTSMNYARYHKLAHFNSIVTFMPSFQLNDCFACVTVLCLVLCLTYVSLQVLRRIYISLFLFYYPTRDLERMPSFFQLWCGRMPVQKALVCFFHHSSSAALKTLPNILVKVVSFDHRVYCKGYYFRHHFNAVYDDF